MKYKPPRPTTKLRSALPIPIERKDGKIELRCPFCTDHHILISNAESPCGTRIEVTAVQEVVPTHVSNHRKLICAKCHKSGGEMVKHNTSFIHAEDCVPGVLLLNELPENSRLAEFVFKLPPSIRKVIERFSGQADQVQEIDEKGKKTGKVLAYFWRTNGK